MNILNKVIGMTFLVISTVQATTSCPIKISESMTDYIAQQSILQELMVIQQKFLERYLDDPRYKSRDNRTFRDFLEVTVAARTHKNITKKELPQQVLEEFGMILIDPRPLQIKLGKEKARVISEECPDYQVLTLSQCHGQSKHFEMHHLIVFYVRNIHGLCGKPITWTPSTMPIVTSFFNLLSSEQGLAKRYEFLVNIQNKRFLKRTNRNNFLKLFYINFVLEAIRSKDDSIINLAVTEILASLQGEFFMEKYPTLRILSKTLRVLRAEGGV